MLDNDYLIFFIASTFMALAIGIDVAIATFVRANYFTSSKQAVIWVVGVSTTHTIFPMLGYGLAYLGVHSLPMLAPVVGIIAFLLILHFLYVELFSPLDRESEGASVWVSLGLILAVSWDALWSGPAKSAQVLGWSDWMVWLSFLWVGLLVSLVCVLSLKAGKRCLNALENKTFWLPVALWLQYSVIAYFGLLALCRFTMQAQFSAMAIFILSCVLIALIQYQKQWRHYLLCKIKFKTTLLDF